LMWLARGISLSTIDGGSSLRPGFMMRDMNWTLVQKVFKTLGFWEFIPLDVEAMTGMSVQFCWFTVEMRTAD
jgi:hypothetical protein